ncbi:DUF1646 family protein [Bacillus salitolerans]|uniref:DUF1646 family protein n=1 Tax=Bacillus salitolerans TaxID=1437434 RepID=A0ABW4LJV1_9BACI
MDIGLLVVLILVLLLPLTNRVVERNLELFIFCSGLAAAWITEVMSAALFLESAKDPITITVAVLIAGLLFKWLHSPIVRTITTISSLLPYRVFIAFCVILLGALSSVITAIIAALVLVLIVSSLQFERKAMIRFVILSCYSIGLGAALTPIGEPLSTVAISKLNGDFFYFIRLLGPEIFIALVAFGLLASYFVAPHSKNNSNLVIRNNESESYEDILTRALKIYFFVMGLTFLGAGFEPLINRYFIHLNPSLLYWINMISAVLDNATLTAAEISAVMSHSTIRSILLGLLISGGMLIPGNIPNIIAAGKLKITSKEWARFAIPIGFLTMLLYYFAMMLFR